MQNERVQPADESKYGKGDDDCACDVMAQHRIHGRVGPGKERINSPHTVFQKNDTDCTIVLPALDDTELGLQFKEIDKPLPGHMNCCPIS